MDTERLVTGKASNDRAYKICRHVLGIAAGMAGGMAGGMATCFDSEETLC